MKYFEKVDEMLAKEFKNLVQNELSRINKYSSDSSKRGEVDMAISNIAAKLEEFLRDYLKHHITNVRKFGYRSDFASRMLREVNYYKKNGADKYVRSFYSHVFNEPLKKTRPPKVQYGDRKEKIINAFKALGNNASLKTISEYMEANMLDIKDLLKGDYNEIINEFYDLDYIHHVIDSYKIVMEQNTVTNEIEGDLQKLNMADVSISFKKTNVVSKKETFFSEPGTLLDLYLSGLNIGEIKDKPDEHNKSEKKDPMPFTTKRLSQNRYFDFTTTKSNTTTRS